MRHGIKAHIALKGTRHPRPDAALTRHGYPLLSTVHAAVQRRLEDDVLRTYGVEQVLLHRRHVHAYELLVEGYGQSRAMSCHWCCRMGCSMEWMS